MDTVCNLISVLERAKSLSYIHVHNCSHVSSPLLASLNTGRATPSIWQHTQVFVLWPNSSHLQPTQARRRFSLSAWTVNSSLHQRQEGHQAIPCLETMGSCPATTVAEIRSAQRADGPAAMLAIGTANPEYCVPQEECPDTYFRAANSDHLIDHKDTFKILCQLTGTEKRYFTYKGELFDVHPDFRDRTLPSVEARLDMVHAIAPELAASAATKAIAQWGRPAIDITHLIVSTNAGAQAPSIDLRLASLLGLRRNVCRTMLHLNGCFAGCAALRLAKDLAENNSGARVLVACVELTISGFHAPAEGECLDTLIFHALFGDGAGAVIVGADPVHPVERPLFEMVSVSQTVIPDTEHVLTVKIKRGGIDGKVSTKLPSMVADHIEPCLHDALGPVAINAKWNDLFWVVHPGALAICDHIDDALKLEPGKLAASRTIARDYGNMLSATIIFVLDEQRRRMQEGEEGGEWGMMVGFGPGFTMETMVLHATENLKKK